jgi:hypothetical protein
MGVGMLCPALPYEEKGKVGSLTTNEKTRSQFSGDRPQVNKLNSLLALE